MKSRIFKNMEWMILISALLLSIVGFVALYSATQSSGFDELKKQVMWFGVSIVIMLVIMLVDYDVWAKLSPVFYGISIILLIAVLFTKARNGASSWFKIGAFTLQPGELAKVAVILFTSSTIVKVQERGKFEINVFWKLCVTLLTVIFPVFLIILQPDYGTAAAYLVSLVLMLYVSGIDKKYIIVASILVVIALPLAYFFVLPNHAKTRIDIFLNPESDPKGAGYNVLQSKIAIGSGELTGMGLLNGNQTQLGYLSPKTTDFIYSVVGEEMGFIISAAVILKFRKGWDSEHIVATEIAKIAQQAGISAITIHGRTRAEYYSGKADLEIIKKVKEAVKIPVIGNGDVVDEESAKEMFEKTGVDGIMIGRASMGNPWIFKKIKYYLETGEKLPKITYDEKLKIIKEHLNLLSGECAQGDYPVECVETMVKIANRVEPEINYWKRFDENKDIELLNYEEKVAYSACVSAKVMNADAIVCYTNSGKTAKRLAGLGAGCPILAITDNKRTFRQLALVWNVTPILVEKGENIEKTIEAGIEKLKNKEILENGDTVVITGGSQMLPDASESKTIGGVLKI